MVLVSSSEVSYKSMTQAKSYRDAAQNQCSNAKIKLPLATCVFKKVTPSLGCWVTT